MTGDRFGSRGAAYPVGPAVGCPVCGVRGLPVLYGLTTPVGREAAGDNLVVLGGCVGDGTARRWECPVGHSWQADDDQIWRATVREAFRGRPRCPECRGPSAYLVYPSDPDIDTYAEDLQLGDAVMALRDPDAGEAAPDRVCCICAHQWCR